MSWRDLHPRPERPPEPGPEPEGRFPEPFDPTAQFEWNLRRSHWNDYVDKLRRHRVAVAVDRILDRRDVLSPAESIAVNVGIEMLEAGLVKSEEG